MRPLVLAVAAFATCSRAGFRQDFPAARIVEAPGGGVTHASGFEAAGLGGTPEAAARAFLARYGAAFGVTVDQELVTRSVPAGGRPGAVRFERRIDGLPLFDGDVAVGVGAENAVVLVNVAAAPTGRRGRHALSREAAVEAAKGAIPGLETADAPRAERGWKAAGEVIRPVWRVDLAADRPPGDWRTYVDAETGKVLLRVDLRAPGLSR